MAKVLWHLDGITQIPNVVMYFRAHDIDIQKVLACRSQKCSQHLSFSKIFNCQGADQKVEPHLKYNQKKYAYLNGYLNRNNLFTSIISTYETIHNWRNMCVPTIY